MRTQHVHAGNICQTEEFTTHENHHVAAKLDAVGWGLFFIWVGMAFLMDIDPGIGLLGVGIITLGMQAVRKSFNLGLEGFWVVVGLAFMAGGFWELFDVQLPLPPILFLVAGLALLLSVVRDKQQRKEELGGKKWRMRSSAKKFFSVVVLCILHGLRQKR